MTDFNDEKNPDKNEKDQKKAKGSNSAKPRDEEGDYEIGYCKPPKHTQFKPNTSGNPKGKPRGTRNFSTDVKDTLKEPVRMKKDGKTKTVSTQHAALLRLREKALSGDGRALDRLMDLARTYNDDNDMAREADKLSQTDDEIMKDYDQRVLRNAGMSPSDDDGDPSDDVADDTAAENENTPEEDDDDDWLN